MADALDILGWKPFGDKKAGKSVPTPAEESAADKELHRGEALETEGRLDAALGPITATLGGFSGSLVGGVANAVLASPGTVTAGP